MVTSLGRSCPSCPGPEAGAGRSGTDWLLGIEHTVIGTHPHSFSLGSFCRAACQKPPGARAGLGQAARGRQELPLSPAAVVATRPPVPPPACPSAVAVTGCSPSGLFCCWWLRGWTLPATPEWAVRGRDGRDLGGRQGFITGSVSLAPARRVAERGVRGRRCAPVALATAGGGRVECSTVSLLEPGDPRVVPDLPCPPRP